MPSAPEGKKLCFRLPPDDAALFPAARQSHPELTQEKLVARLVSRALRECYL